MIKVNIPITYTAQTPQLDSAVEIVTGNRCTVTATFALSADWDAFPARTAVFESRSAIRRAILDEQNTVTVPADVLNGAERYVKISVFGVAELPDGEIARYNGKPLTLRISAGGAVPADTDTSEPAYEQLLVRVEAVEESLGAAVEYATLAAESATDAADKANNAAERAEDAAENVTTAVEDVQQAAELAKEAAANAESAVANAETAVEKADAAAASANTAAENANTAAGAADTAASKADTAASKADTAAGSANTAADKANTAAGTANTAASKADNAASKADTAAGSANTAADKANTAAGTANTAASKADNAAGKADTAAGSANTAAGTANTAAGTANTAAEKATTAAGKADTAASIATNAASTAAQKCEEWIFDMDDGTEVVVKNIVTVELYSFTIDGVAYKCIAGAMWANWVVSDFNTDGYYVSQNDGAVCSSTGYSIGQSKMDIIVNGRAYETAGGADQQSLES